MGIYDRDYYRKSPTTARQILTWTQSAVGLLIATNFAVYLVQLIGQETVTDFLAAQPGRVFEGQVWKLLTANFAHSTGSPWHIVGNMMFLWLLGRELEHIYGRRDFLILYLSAGVLAMLAEASCSYFLGRTSVKILGASGAVMAVVALCTLFYPMKKIGLMFLPPVPLWMLCVFYVAMDLFGTFQGSRSIANIAHLTGFLVGFLYWFFDLRLGRLRLPWRLRRRSAARQPAGKIVQMPRDLRGAGVRREEQGVYQKVDQLLAKIHDTGMDSLTGEELEFLKANAGRFRREDEPS